MILKENLIKFNQNRDFFTKSIVRMLRANKLGCHFFRRSSFKMPNHIKFGKNETHITFPLKEKGVKYAFLDIFLDDVYSLSRLKDVESILDIGAHIGFFSLAAQKQFPEATIHAYEPNPCLIDYLKHNLQQTNVTFFNEEIGLSAGKLSLDINEDSVCTTSHESEDSNIIQTAFSNAIERLGGSVDLVKMDCEGAEWRFLSDCESWSKIKRLHMEFHLFKSNQTLDILIKQLQSLGFKIDFVLHKGNNGILYAHR